MDHKTVSRLGFNVSALLAVLFVWHSTLGDVGDIGIFAVKSLGFLKADHVCNTGGNNGISRDIHNSLQSVQEPINGNHELKSIRDTSGSKDRVVGSQDHDKTSRGDWGGSSTSNSGEDAKKDIVSKVGLNSVQDGQPDAGTGKVDRGSC